MLYAISMEKTPRLHLKDATNFLTLNCYQENSRRKISKLSLFYGILIVWQFATYRFIGYFHFPTLLIIVHCKKKVPCNSRLINRVLLDQAGTADVI